MAKKKDDERCMACELAVSIGGYLRVCRKVEGKKKCEILMDKVAEKKITPEQLFRKIRKKVKKGSKEAKMLDEIDGFLREEGHKIGKSKKKKKKQHR